MNFYGPANVDARGSLFNNVTGDQHNNFNQVRPEPPNPPPNKRPRHSGPSRQELPKTSTNTEQIPKPRFLQEQHFRSAPAGLNASVLLNDNPMTILHSEKLPTSGLPLQDALVEMPANLSPWKDSVQWTITESEHANSVLDEIIELTKNGDIKHVRFTDLTVVYPRLIVYTFSHLMLCVRDRRFLDEFKENLRKWKDWDKITVIQNHQQVKDYVRGVFRTLHSAAPGLHPQRTFEVLLTYDVLGLAAHLTNIVLDKKRHEILISRQEEAAQSLLDLLQARLDLPIDHDLKCRYTRLLIKLSKASSFYPQCLVLKDVEKIGYPVAEGGFGTVFKGRFRGHDVAVKVLKIYKNSNEATLLKEFSCEAVTWLQLNHRNILPLYGVFCEPTVSLVSPWMDNGNIVSFLGKENPKSNCILLCLDVAEGLEYLHGEGIVHGDIKGVNILITQSHRACLADFGLASARDTNPTLSTSLSSLNQLGGTLRWQGPELLPYEDSPEQRPRSTRASDVYAFGLIFSGYIPFHTISNDYSIPSFVRKGGRPPRPDNDLSQARGLTNDVWHYIGTCWDHDPAKRPLASDIAKKLHALPNRPVDERRLDDLISPSALLSTHNPLEHPFAAFLPGSEDTEQLRHLKCSSDES